MLNYLNWFGMKICLILCLAFSSSAFADITYESILPGEFTVYYHPEEGISTKPFKEAEVKKIFTNNDYKDSPGCYLLCVSKNKQYAAYEIDNGVYIIGQIRVPGCYDSGLCLPKGYEEQSLPELKIFKEKCEKAFPQYCEKESCWANS
jgi:hypothetical protein